MARQYISRHLENKKILVTGGRGFLGSHLVSKLRRICGSVDIYQKDIRKINAFTKRYDIVCHLAGFTKINSDVSTDLLFDVNVNGTMAVMQYCYKAGARCILASSAAVYGPAVSNRLLHEGLPLKPRTLYGISKMLAENICKYHAENFGSSIVALRIFNMYGAGQPSSFIIPYVMRHFARNKAIELKTPLAVRDFVSVKDVAEVFILACAYKGFGFRALNTGTGYGLSIYELVTKIASHMGVNPRIKGTGFKENKKDFVVADLQNISKFINWHPKILIDNGIRQMLR